MKCQHCEKPATFHITELTGPEVEELHLCEEHARRYLASEENPAPSLPTIAEALAQHLKVKETAKELARLDKRTCPICGISFYEFRRQGRLGCPHDYVFFEDELEPLIVNIHNANEHRGKHPQRGAADTDQRSELISLRRQMKEAVERENYETASKLRDKIRQIEHGAASKTTAEDV